MKKFVFSVASRATGRLQIKPSGSGDENGQRKSQDKQSGHPSDHVRLRRRPLTALACNLTLPTPIDELGNWCLKGQMNQKIDKFSFVALPSPNTKKNYPK